MLSRLGTEAKASVNIPSRSMEIRRPRDEDDKFIVRCADVRGKNVSVGKVGNCEGVTNGGQGIRMAHARPCLFRLSARNSPSSQLKLPDSDPN